MHHEDDLRGLRPVNRRARNPSSTTVPPSRPPSVIKRYSPPVAPVMRTAAAAPPRIQPSRPAPTPAWDESDLQPIQQQPRPIHSLYAAAQAADLSVVFDAPAAANVMLWDPTPTGSETVVDSASLARESAVKLSVSALSTLQIHLSCYLPADGAHIGFLVSSARHPVPPSDLPSAAPASPAVGAPPPLEFDCFDKGITMSGDLLPTHSRGTSVPIYFVHDSDATLLNSLKTSHRVRAFVFNAALVKLSYIDLSPRAELTVTPIRPLRLVENSVSARLVCGDRQLSSGYLSVNRARRAYLLRKEPSSLPIAGVWISGTKDGVFGRHTLGVCTEFAAAPNLQRVNQPPYLLAVFPVTASAPCRFYKWKLETRQHQLLVADFRPSTGKWLVSPLQPKEMLGITRPYSPVAQPAAAATSSVVEPVVSAASASSVSTRASASPAVQPQPQPQPQATNPPSPLVPAQPTAALPRAPSPPQLPLTSSSAPADASLQQMVLFMMQQLDFMRTQIALQQQPLPLPPQPAPAPAPAPAPDPPSRPTYRSMGVNTSFVIDAVPTPPRALTESIGVNTSAGLLVPSTEDLVAALSTDSRLLGTFSSHGHGHDSPVDLPTPPPLSRGRTGTPRLVPVEQTDPLPEPPFGDVTMVTPHRPAVAAPASAAVLDRRPLARDSPRSDRVELSIADISQRIAAQVASPNDQFVLEDFDDEELSNEIYERLGGGSVSGSRYYYSGNDSTGPREEWLDLTDDQQHHGDSARAAAPPAKVDDIEDDLDLDAFMATIESESPLAPSAVPVPAVPAPAPKPRKQKQPRRTVPIAAPPPDDSMLLGLSFSSLEYLRKYNLIDD
ncbi:hypothetical protein H9P43_001530 [Blastocladiella emersonii ATCC 22665]|nr:hypothetical protein H9P43_001530 [Blastocladiella emersonii ATCC 22665]